MTKKTFERKHVNMLNTADNYLVESRGLSPQIRKLHLDSFHIRAYADTSFATNQDLTLQVGYIVLLCDKWDISRTLQGLQKQPSILNGIFFLFVTVLFNIQVQFFRAINGAIDEFIRCSKYPPRSRTMEPNEVSCFCKIFVRNLDLSLL